MSSGTFSFTLTAKNATGLTQKTFTLTINAVVPKITGSVPSGTTGKSFTSKLKATGTAPIVWDCEGNLPAGLNFDNSTGLISGTPTETFDGYITITAMNSGGQVAKSCRLLIKADKAANTKAGNNDVKETEDFSQEQETEIISAPDTAKIIEVEKEEKIAETVSEKISTGLERSIELIKNLISEDEYILAAALPEIKANESGQYDFKIELDSSIEAGKELVWLAFPKNNEASEDDSIAEFYDDTGEEITTVPENHLITVSAWLNEGIIYAPVIAVKK